MFSIRGSVLLCGRMQHSAGQTINRIRRWLARLQILNLKFQIPARTKSSTTSTPAVFSSPAATSSRCGSRGWFWRGCTTWATFRLATFASTRKFWTASVRQCPSRKATARTRWTSSISMEPTQFGSQSHRSPAKRRTFGCRWRTSARTARKKSRRLWTAKARWLSRVR